MNRTPSNEVTRQVAQAIRERIALTPTRTRDGGEIIEARDVKMDGRGTHFTICLEESDGTQLWRRVTVSEL